MTICVLGDSVAKGVVFDEAKNKYTLIKNSFSDIYAKRHGIPLVNYAKFGCTVAKGIEILNRHLSELSAFSYTVMEFGGNDCDLDWNEISHSPHGTHLPKVPLARFEEIYIKMAEIIKSKGSIPVALTLPPLEPERFFKWVSKGLDRKNIIKYIGNVGAIYRWQESYSDAIKKVAEANSIRLIDIREIFLSKSSYSDFLCIDGMHPNEKGHELIGRALIL